MTHRRPSDTGTGGTRVPGPLRRDDAVRARMAAVCTGLVDAQGRLDTLNAEVGDGNTGSTFATVARRLLERLDHLPFDDPPALLTTVSAVFATSMGGCSGVLGAVFFAAAGRTAAGSPLAEVLAAGVTAVRREGGADLGDRTLLDALVPAVDVLRAGGGLEHAALAAERGATATAAMSAVRAGPTAQLQAPDPGAAAIAVAFRAAADASVGKHRVP